MIVGRPIVLSNGNLHVGINDYGLVHDFYYPYVGLENHSAGPDLRHLVGIWTDGAISWLTDSDWDIHFESQVELLGGRVRAHNDRIGVIVEFDDVVDSSVDAFLRSVHIVNTRDYERDIRLFMHQAFDIGDAKSYTDTAQYLPDNDAIVHYRGRRAFVVGAKTDDGQPFDQFTVGIFGIEGKEGSYRDADDGELEGCSVEHGRVDSVIRFKFSIAAHDSTRVFYWLSAGESLRDALLVHKTVDLQGYEKRHTETAHWWKKWLEPTVRVAAKLPKHRQELFIKSAMVLKSHTDNRGAIIASTDTAMLNYWRDVYGYCWPRDGAYVLWPLIRIGYTEEPLNFFRFCREQLHPRGYLHHKYRADGALGSSWHSYVHGDITAAPIQEDETASVLFMFTQYYHVNPSDELLDEFYPSLIKPMANFMESYIDETTHLPKPSYDLWEEVFMTSTYTTATVHAALLAAAEIADIRHDDTSAVKWRSAAEHIEANAKKYLYNDERKMLRKGILRHEDGAIDYLDTLDQASFYGAYMYGLFASDSNEVRTTLEASLSTFAGGESFNGLPRYEHDNYLRKDNADPNAWYITSLWLAQYYLETNKIDSAEEILSWVEARASSTGLFSEQIDASTGEQLSVSPLAWSHAEYLATILDLTTNTDHGK